MVEKKKTPESWDSPKDARESESAGQYPNYYSHKTRSGHAFMMDDSNGSEHVTLQHRSGSFVQFMPDGGIQFTAQNGQYNVTFGENRMLITGAYDITVQGGASLKVDGDYNVNVKGDVNFNVNGDLNMTAQNINSTVRGNYDIQAKNKTEKIEGSSTSQSHGATAIMSKGGMTIGSSGDSVAIGGKNQVGIIAKGGEVAIKSGSKTSILSEEVAIEASGTASMKGGTAVVEATSGDLTTKASGTNWVQADSTVKAFPAVITSKGGGSGTAADDVESIFTQAKSETPKAEPDTPID